MSNQLMAALHTQENFGPLWKQSNILSGGTAGKVLAKIQKSLRDVAARLSGRATLEQHLLDASEQLSNQEALIRNMVAQAQRDEQRLLAAQAESASKYKGWVPLATAGLAGSVALPAGLVGGALLWGDEGRKPNYS
jgi:hypothetical protein